MAGDSESHSQGKYTTIPIQPVDYTAAMHLAETRNVIMDAIMLDLCGITRVKQPNNDYKYKRLSKPVYTYDYCLYLSSKLYYLINRISGRTTLDREEIRRFALWNAKEILLDMAIQGMQNLVSDRVWNAAIQYSEPILILDSESKQPIIITNENGEQSYKFTTKWRELGITWEFNEPLTIKMLTILKNEEKLNDEHFAQDVPSGTAFANLVTFIKFGLNRSLNALTLDFEKVVHKETVTQSEAIKQERPKESFFDALRVKKTQQVEQQNG